jgi:hypothetical protein
MPSRHETLQAEVSAVEGQTLGSVRPLYRPKLNWFVYAPVDHVSPSSLVLRQIPALLYLRASDTERRQLNQAISVKVLVEDQEIAGTLLAEPIAPWQPPTQATVPSALE